MSPNDPQDEPKKKRADSEKEIKRNRFLSMLGFFRRGKKKKEEAPVEEPKQSPETEQQAAEPQAKVDATKESPEQAVPSSNSIPDIEDGPSDEQFKAPPKTADEERREAILASMNATVQALDSSTDEASNENASVEPAEEETEISEAPSAKIENSERTDNEEELEEELDTATTTVSAEPESKLEKELEAQQTSVVTPQEEGVEESSEEPTPSANPELLEAVTSTVEAAREDDLATSLEASDSEESSSPEQATEILEAVNSGFEAHVVASLESRFESPGGDSEESEDLEEGAEDLPEVSEGSEETLSEDEDSEAEAASEDEAEEETEEESQEKEEVHAPDIMAHLDELPRSYQSNRARLIMVDPERLFLHWNFNAAEDQALVMQFRQHFLGQPHVLEMVPLGPQNVGTYYFVTQPGAFYDALFGVVNQGRFQELFRSNLVETPPVRPRYSEVAVWKVRETVPAPAAEEPSVEPIVSVWRDPEPEESELVAASVAEPKTVETIAHSTPAAPPPPRPQAPAPQAAPAPAFIETPEPSPQVQWVDVDYEPPHLSTTSDRDPVNALSSAGEDLAGPSFSGPSVSEEELPLQGFAAPPKSVVHDELQLPSVRWIGASEFILVGKPGSLIPPFPDSQWSSWNVHVSASEPVRRSS